MAINKKRDFKKLAVCIKEFLSRLPCNESTGFLRDTLYLSLLELHRYYIKEKDRLNSSLRQSNETLTAAALSSKQRLGFDKYESRWHGFEESSKERKSEGFLAAFQGDIAKLKATVQSDDGDVLGQTYLMYAVQGNNVQQNECLDFLLSLQFNINQQANDGSTTLHLACQQNKKTFVTSLLKHKANTTIQDKKGRTSLHWAAINPSSEISKLLLQHGADINVKDCDGMTPVMWACRFNKLENVHLFKNALERIDPRCEAIFEDRDDNGETVLHWAVPMSNKDGIECLKDLLVSDVSHIRNNQGRTILHTAAKEGCVSACELILSICGKEILHVRDNQNQTALHLATLCGHGETVDHLLQNGADTSDENSCGRTALQEAELGHYHYCLLVFAAFEHMKGHVEKNKPKTPKEDERNSTNSRKYESWVIPTDCLNDSQELSKPVTTHDVVPERQTTHDVDPERQTTHDVDPKRQLVDVTEIKGFEVNGDMLSPRKISEKIINTTNHGALLQRNKKIEDKEQSITIDNKLNQVKVGCHENVAVVPVATDNDDGDNEQLEHQEYSQEHGSVLSSLASNNSVEEFSMSENVEVSSFGNDTDEEHSKSDVEYDNNFEKDGPEQNLNTKESEESQGKSSSLIKTNNKEPTSKNTGGHKVNLTTFNPLKPPNINTPAKLDPIQSPFTTPKSLDKLGQSTAQPAMQLRGIVAPLQPSALLGFTQKETLKPLLRGENRPHSYTSNTAYYETRAPDHGPLAYSHGKALLNNVFQADVPKKKPGAKNSESQRRTLNNKPGKFPHPPKH